MKPGIYDISDGDYQADCCESPSLSSSIAKILINETPLHAWTAHPRLNPEFVREEKEVFDLGTVAHALMLQGLSNGHVIKATRWEGRGKNRIDTGELVEDYKTKEAREERAAARAAGKVPILANQWTRVQAMIDAGRRQIMEHKEAAKAFSDGTPEVVLIWEDDHGITCRARLDWLHYSRKKFSDYKSTGMTANPEALSRSMFGSGWDIQEAFYRRGLMKLGFDAVGTFICQEDSAPYALSAIGFNPLIQRVADGKVQMAIDLWAKCLKEDNWPGYPDRICYPEMPAWMEKQAMEKELTNAV